MRCVALFFVLLALPQPNMPVASKAHSCARHSHGLRCPKTPSCSLFRSLAGAFPKIDRALLRIAINLPQLCLRKLELPNRVKLYALFYPIVRIYFHMIQNGFLASSNADMDGLEIPLDCL
jgi:hypothetical protein